MNYRVIGKSQIKLVDSSFANVDEIVTDKQVGVKVQAYLDNGSIEPARLSKAPKAEPKTAESSDEWTMKQSPEAYLKRYPKGPSATLAKKIIKAK